MRLHGRLGFNSTVLDIRTLRPPGSCFGLCAQRPNLHAYMSRSLGSRAANELGNLYHHHAESSLTLDDRPGIEPLGAVFARPAPRPMRRTYRLTSGYSALGVVRSHMKTVCGSTTDNSNGMNAVWWPVLCASPGAFRDRATWARLRASLVTSRSRMKPRPLGTPFTVHAGGMRKTGAIYLVAGTGKTRRCLGTMMRIAWLGWWSKSQHPARAEREHEYRMVKSSLRLTR